MKYISVNQLSFAKGLSLVAFLGCLSLNLLANVTNDGTTITILSGTTVTVLGNVENKSGSTISNAGTIELVNGDFENNGANSINGLVKFSGNDGAIAGTSTFKDVEIDAANGIQVLGVNNIFNENLFVKRAGITAITGVGSINYGANANLEYNGITNTVAGLEFTPYVNPYPSLTNYNPKTITINNAAGVALNSKKQLLNVLVLKNGILNSNNNLVIVSTPNRTGVVDDFDAGTTSGNISNNLEIQRYIKPTTNQVNHTSRFHYIGALTGGTVSKWTDDFSLNLIPANVADGTNVTPTSNCDVAFLASNSAYGNIFTFHENDVTACALRAWKVRTSTALTPRGLGFAASINGGTIIDEIGGYGRNDVSLGSLSITASNNTASRGEHLVANPFFAPIDWNVVATLPANTNLDQTAYRYNPNTGTFNPFNNITGNAYFSTNEAFVVMPLNNTLSSYNLTIPASARVVTDNNEMLRQQQPYLYALDITVAANNEIDNTLVAFDNLFTDAYDNGYDAKKLNSSLGVPTLFTKNLANEKSSILAISEGTQHIVVPLGIEVAFNGNHTFTFNGVNDFPVTSIIWLEDLKTGDIQYLRQNNVYSFVGNKTDAHDRFLIHFTPRLEKATTVASCNGNNDAQIFLNQTGGVEWNYTLLNENNDVIATGTSFTGLDTINNLTPGTFTLQLEHASGYAAIEEIIVSGSPLVDAAFNSSANTVEQNDLVTFEATGTGAINYTWDMGDGTVYNNETIVNHSYANAGTYQVVLIADNGVCSDKAIIEIVVNETIITTIFNSEAGKLLAYHYGDKLFFKQTFTIEEAKLNATLYNALGQTVLTINEPVLAHNQVLTVPLSDIANGAYILQLKAGDKTAVKKIVIGK
jgi:hypothetical protein